MKHSSAKPRVAVIYHFFAHYRSAVIEALSRDDRCQWTFLGDDHDIEGGGIKAAEFGPGIRFRRIRSRVLRPNVLWQSGVLGAAVSGDYDVLVLLGNPKHLAMWPAALLGRITGKRVLFWTHGWTYRPHGPLRHVRRWFYRLGHGILTYGRWAKAIGIEEGFAPARIHVIGNSLDFEAQSRAYATLSPTRRDEVRMQLFGESSNPVVAWTGRLTKLKRLDLIFDALELLAARGIRANVVMIGDGPERAALERRAGELGIKVHFEGACYDEGRIAELIYCANVTASPGHVGLTSLHSLAFGTPVVTHDDPAHQAPEFEAIVPGVTGDLYPFGSVERLAAALEPWLRSPSVDDAIRSRCRTMVERFWSPAFQREALVRAVRGEDADDLFFIRSPRSAAPGG